MTPEFPRPHRLDQIGAGETNVEIEASPEERVALARRFDLVAIDRLAARFALHRDAIGVRASGHLSAAVTQSCGVTGDPLPARIEEDFAIRFLPEPSEEESQDEVELAEEDLDTVFYTGSALDLGEAAAETLALALDPFPRSPRAAEVLKAAGVISEEEVESLGPLAAALRDKLNKPQ
jgi:uncharacterized metal-binding protein YceD (DUF177 family)